jgi:hypothetical protein
MLTIYVSEHKQWALKHSVHLVGVLLFYGSSISLNSDQGKQYITVTGNLSSVIFLLAGHRNIQR